MRGSEIDIVQDTAKETTRSYRTLGVEKSRQIVSYMGYGMRD